MDMNEKYSFLLNPIKDLTKNWNIDIAGMLEDYLDELLKVTFSFDGGKTSMNFAEASYVIQGSACVWSRKVEYLHSLVHETLDLLLSSKKNDNQTSDSRKNKERRYNAKDFDEFICFYDMEKGQRKSCNSKNASDVVRISKGVICLDGIYSENRGTKMFSAESNDSPAYFYDFALHRCIQTDDALLNLDVMWQNNFAITPQPSTRLHPVTADDLSEDVFHDDVAADSPDVVEMDVANAAEDLPPDEPDSLLEEHLCRRYRARDLSLLPNPIAEEEEVVHTLLDPHDVCHERDWLDRAIHPGRALFYKHNSRKATGKFLPLLQYALEEFGTRKKEDGKNLWSLEIKKQHQHRRERLKKLKSLHNVNCGRRNSVEDERNGGDDADEVFESEDDELNDLPESFTPLTDDQQLAIASGEGCENSYEALIELHVNNFYKSARLFAEESELSKRVKQWEEDVTPFLQEEAARPRFDIHQCGRDVIGRLERGQAILFSDLCQSEPTWSICRKFASTLQLVNDRKLDLTKPEGATVNTMKLQLLN